jgi:hypothetical protein
MLFVRTLMCEADTAEEAVKLFRRSLAEGDSRVNTHTHQIEGEVTDRRIDTAVSTTILEFKKAKA